MQMFSVLQQDSKRLQSLTTELEASLHSYFHTYAEFDPVRFPATALTTAVENPDLPFWALEQIVRVPVWIFTIDAVIDEHHMPENILRDKLKLYGDIARGHRDVDSEDDPYAAVLRDIRRNLEARPLFPALAVLWEACYERMIDGMLIEALEGRHGLTYDEYLNHGSYSIGLPLYVVSTWIIQLDTDANLDLDRMFALTELAGTCVRLANDLRTYEKETREGNLNAVTLKQRDYEVDSKAGSTTSLEQAFDFVRSELSRLMEQFRASCSLDTKLERALFRLTEFSVGFYEVTDFHTVTGTELRRMMGVSREGDECESAR